MRTAPMPRDAAAIRKQLGRCGSASWPWGYRKPLSGSSPRSLEPGPEAVRRSMTIGDKESMTEAGLVAGLKSKDEAAVRALVDRYGDKLLRAAAAILGDVHQAED